MAVSLLKLVHRFETINSLNKFNNNFSNKMKTLEKQIKKEFQRRKKKLQKQKQILNRKNQLECKLHSLEMKKEAELETYQRRATQIKIQLKKKQRSLLETRGKIEELQANGSFMRNPGRKQKMQLFRIYQMIQKLKDEMKLLKDDKLQLDEMSKQLLPAIDNEICQAKMSLENFGGPSTTFDVSSDEDLDLLEDEEKEGCDKVISEDFVSPSKFQMKNNQNQIPKLSTPVVPSTSSDFIGSNPSGILRMLKHMAADDDNMSMEDSDEDKDESNGDIPSWFLEMSMFEVGKMNK